jgi:S-(hydroxymethyl)glutathione dehydrogenase/alcohol dehydrogenase
MPSVPPVILGHEASGVVEALGPGVTTLAVGDHVVLSPCAPCGHCPWCVRGEWSLCANSDGLITATHPDGGTRLSRHGEVVHRGLAVAGFAEHVVIQATGAIKIPDDVPLSVACVVGCAVQTGVGAVLNTAGVLEGDTVLVMGLGGVGLSVVQGARLAEAGIIIAVDRSPEKLALAQSMGATEVLEAGDELAKQVRALTGRRGADHAFDCVGLADTIRTSWSATRRGGTTTIVGIGGKEQQVTFTALELFHFARTLQGCVYGSTDPMTDIPKVLGYAAEGRLDLGALISGTIGLDGIDGAFADMEKGVGARAVVVPS